MNVSINVGVTAAAGVSSTAVPSSLTAELHDLVSWHPTDPKCILYWSASGLLYHHDSGQPAANFQHEHHIRQERSSCKCHLLPKSLHI